MIHKSISTKDYSKEAKRGGVIIPIKKMLEQCAGDLFRDEGIKGVKDEQGLTQGDLLRDEGISQAEKNANQTWFAEAMFWVEVVAKYKPEFTTDDVWGWLESDMEPGTHDNRAMGAVMRKAQRQGWIEPTDRVRRSTRAVCHSRPVRVWRSKLI